MTALLAAAIGVTLLASTQEAWAAGASAAGISCSAAWTLRRRPALSVGLVGWLSLGVCAWAALSWTLVRSSWNGAGEFQQWLSLALFFLAASACLTSADHRLRLLQALAAFGALIATWAIVQPYAGRFGLAWMAAASDDMVGPFHNRNTFGAFVELAFPSAVWLAYRKSAEWWLAAGLLLASAVMTGSRAGAVLVLVEALALAIWLRKSTIAAIFAAAIIGGMLWGNAEVATRLGYGDPLEHRRDIYASSLELIRQRPFAGWGLGMFERVYPREARFDTGLRVNHAHNDLLEAAVEGGLPLAGTSLAVLLLILWKARSSTWALGLGAVALHAAVDFPFQRLGVVVWFTLIAAAAAARVFDRRRSRAGTSRSRPMTPEGTASSR